MAASPAARLNVSELPAQADDDQDTDSIRDESGQRRGSDPSRVCRHFHHQILRFEQQLTCLVRRR